MNDIPKVINSSEVTVNMDDGLNRRNFNKPATSINVDDGDEYILPNIDAHGKGDIVNSSINEVENRSILIYRRAHFWSYIFSGIITLSQFIIMGIGLTTAILSLKSDGDKTIAYVVGVLGITTLTVEGLRTKLSIDQRADTLMRVYTKALQLSRITKRLRGKSFSVDQIQRRLDKISDRLSECEHSMFSVTMIKMRTDSDKDSMFIDALTVPINTDSNRVPLSTSPTTASRVRSPVSPRYSRSLAVVKGR